MLTGSAVARTAAKAIWPGTDRSSPRCCTTSVSPAETIASTAAYGSMLSSAALPMLPGATSGLMTNKVTVAIQIVVDRPTKARRQKRRLCSGLVVAWLIGFPSLAGTARTGRPRRA